MVKQQIVVAGGDQAIFASDMHLGEHDLDTATYFLDALEQMVSGLRPTHLFLLGDLFELWVGDDDARQMPAPRLSIVLKTCSQRGCQVFIMGGNRDFLLGNPMPSVYSWVEQAGAKLLPDPCLVSLFGRPTVLTHGDILCTKDSAYQAFRIGMRDPHWVETLLQRPLTERRELGASVRLKSEHDKQGKPMAWMDAQESAVIKMLREHGATQMIHGHTHLPQLHRHDLNAGKSAPPEEALRWVLTDWQAPSSETGSTARGAFLQFDQKGAVWLSPAMRNLQA